MCGIIGIYSRDGIDVDIIKKMNDMIKHRGPDDEGYFILTENLQSIHAVGKDSPLFGKFDAIESIKGKAKVALANRRLSIIDVSEKGHQPLFFENFALVLNGEIYNYREIRRELEDKGYNFYGDSDTEVALKAIAEYGFDEALKKFIGMFAVLVYDKAKNTLYGARDRFGIKPLFYYNDEENFYFASEIKGFLPVVELKPNKERMAEYLLFKRKISEKTFFDGIKQILPASYFILSKDGLKIEKYWNPRYESTLNAGNNEVEKYVKAWKEKFAESVSLHLRSDVPLGFEVSGGIDSTSLVSISKEMLEKSVVKERGFDLKNIKLFNVKIKENVKIDESSIAEKFAEYLGLKDNLIEISVSPQDFLSELEKIIYFEEEPPEGLSPILHWFLSKEASKHVKVLLNGQGGDELLGGYHAYIPLYIKEVLRKKGVISAIKETWKLRYYIFDKAKYALKVYIGKRESLGMSLLGKDLKMHNSRDSISILNEALYKDLTGGRLAEILRVEDRNSMAHSIEIRVPYINHILAEFTLSMPEDLKIRNGYTKWIHRKAMEGLVPKDILWSKKKLGFQAPEYEWLILLKKNFIEVLSNSELVKDGFLKADAVRGLIKNVEKEKIDRELSRFYWRVFLLEVWYRTFFKHKPQF
ncbi:asparagine synthase (glutamine-hydrolyzing) [Fervidicoccus sp.]|uniref:asparagine synthase (glutamine-hydrolyzing) n=1 Tax=Fervidicoccus sp. TaxID=2060324 RepID=UPI003D140F8E